jgi:hypothetical protein
MDNPEYTERLINAALKDQSPLDIRVHWDGYYPDPEDDATFDVHFNEDETVYVVWDRGSDIDVAERIGKQAYSQIDGSRSHEVVAGIIIAIIEADIKAGKLGEEA